MLDFARADRPHRGRAAVPQPAPRRSPPSACRRASGRADKPGGESAISGLPCRACSRRLLSATLVGLDGRVIRVEVDVAPGLPGFTIVGLPDAALSEARERVRGALRNAGFLHPPRRITVNLAPADVPKTGASLDLAIALGILLGSEQFTRGSGRIALIGELGAGRRDPPCARAPADGRRARRARHPRGSSCRPRRPRRRPRAGDRARPGRDGRGGGRGRPARGQVATSVAGAAAERRGSAGGDDAARAERPRRARTTSRSRTWPTSAARRRRGGRSRSRSRAGTDCC